MSILTCEIVITHKIGLHARPAVKFTKLAKTFAADIQIRELPDGASVDAKSIAKVMGLKARSGRTLEIAASGADAQAALAALSDLVKRDFDEAA